MCFLAHSLIECLAIITLPVNMSLRSSEDVILQLIRSKCIPALLYGLEACPFRLSDYNSLDFVVNRFFNEIVRNE